MSFDRRVGFGLGFLAVAGLLVSVGWSEPPTVTLHNDEAAFDELVGLLEANEGGDWLVRYTAGRELHSGESTTRATAEARRGGARVRREPTSVTTERGDEKVECNIAGDHVECLRGTVAPGLSAADIVRTLVGSGAYVVTRLPDETIADEDAQCFRVFGTGGFEATYGLERQYCFASDGVLLRQQEINLLATDERIATAVVRDPTEADVAELVVSLERAAALAAG